jgi:hypothetical protein
MNLAHLPSVKREGFFTTQSKKFQRKRKWLLLLDRRIGKAFWADSVSKKGNVFW